MTNVRPQPKINSEYQTVHECLKCAGTGFFCLGVLDGVPYSNTGFDCHKCGGQGWIVRNKRGAKKVYLSSSELTNLQAHGSASTLKEANDKINEAKNSVPPSQRNAFQSNIRYVQGEGYTYAWVLR